MLTLELTEAKPLLPLNLGIFITQSSLADAWRNTFSSIVITDRPEGIQITMGPTKLAINLAYCHPTFLGLRKQCSL